MCCERAIDGYTGGTDEIKCAAFTSPPTGNGTAGAIGCLVFPATSPPPSESPAGTICPDEFSESATASPTTAPVGCVALGAER
jgi:hypothetical protein